jgi:hypothetical protein
VSAKRRREKLSVISSQFVVAGDWLLGKNEK